MKQPVTLIFDVGKTNKKIFLFDKDYNVVYEETTQLGETKDEDDFPCEDVYVLTNWIKDSFNRLFQNKNFEIKAVNFSAYGASLVYLDEAGKVFLPLYNYLKPYPQQLQNEFYNKYGGEKYFGQQTASPVLGSLNSGMQLYRFKYEQPDLFDKIKYALHLPQYLSYVLSLKPYSEITSVGCHTNLWNFEENNYHSWIYKEGIDKKLAPIVSSKTVAGYVKNIPVGVGLHDSSAALIPYLTSVGEPFILLSTGTWCISLNPFNHSILTDEELNKDCLCYLNYQGKPVKSSRLFAGYEHEHQTKKLAAYFNKPENYFETVPYNKNLLNSEQQQKSSSKKNLAFNAADFKTYEEAYHYFILNIIQQQVESIQLVLTENIKSIYVDGGFNNNKIYMHLLADALPHLSVCKVSATQASALGSAMAVNKP